MFRKFTIVLALAMGSLAACAAFADGPGSGGGYETGSQDGQTVSVVNNLRASQTGHRVSIECLDGPGGSGY